MTVIIDGTNGLTFPDSSQQYNSYYGFKNRIINGAMQIAQRGTSGTWNSTTVTPSSASYVSVDRFRQAQPAGSTSTWGTGVITAAQSTTVPAGFYNSLSLTVSTADASSTATNAYGFVQQIEAYNLADLNLGSANAQPMALSFWVRSSVTGTYAGSLFCFGTTNYSYVFTYTVSVANTWTYVTVNVPAFTTNNTPFTGTNGLIGVFFDLGSGSNLQTATTNAWVSGSYISTSGATKLIANASATYYITGIQLEKGSVATAFDYRPFGTELALCERYYETGFYVWRGYTAAGATNYGGIQQFSVTKRVSPIIATNSFSGGPMTSATIGTVVPSGFDVYSAASVAQSAAGYSLYWTASSEL
jgi:hypothetical protein